MNDHVEISMEFNCGADYIPPNDNRDARIVLTLAPDHSIYFAAMLEAEMKRCTTIPDELRDMYVTMKIAVAQLGQVLDS